MEIVIQVVPRASRTQVVGPHGNGIKIRVAAPPVDGEANEELVRYLAKVLGVTRSSVTIVSGDTGKRKRVRIVGVGVAEASTRLLPPHPPAPSPS